MFRVPVNPWQITFVFFANIDTLFYSLNYFFAASLRSEADKIFKFDLSNISFPSLKFVPANLTTKGTDKFIS